MTQLRTVLDSGHSFKMLFRMQLIITSKSWERPSPGRMVVYDKKLWIRSELEVRNVFCSIHRR